jgi:preprotein translocase subunit SecE
MKISQLPKKIAQFLKEVRVELKRVTWPTRQQTIKYTLMVIGLSLAVAVFLGGLDFLFTWLLNNFVI